ncbi:MAG: HAD family hydrolase [Clostridia bacterium]|nr:HAD family hydrolase [Clostridia bacterium]
MGEPIRLALFDFDGTLIPGDSIALLVRWARRKKAMTGGEFFSALIAAGGYGLGLVSAKESKERALRFLQRFSGGEQEKLCRAFVNEALLPLVYPRGIACVRGHQAAGRKAVLVTASTDNYMLLIGRALGFDAVLATPYFPDGRLGENCKGEEKPKRVAAWLSDSGLQADYAASWAYGDSGSDLPMLRLCGHPVRVNAKKALRKAAPDMRAEEWTHE